MEAFLERRDSDFHNGLTDYLTFPPHLHKYVEIVYIISGKSMVTINGEQYTLNSGDLSIAFPYSVHSYKDENIKLSHLIIFSVDYVPLLEEILKNKIPKNPIIKNKSLSKNAKIFLEFLKEKAVNKSDIEKRNKNDVLSNTKDTERIVLSGILTAFLAEVFKNMEFTDSLKNKTVNSIINFCKNHFAENIKIEDLSKEIYISTSRISHIFSEKIGMGFKEYINRLRIEKAAGMIISTEENIGEIAISCGYESLRTFNRNFLKFKKCTPKEFKKLTAEQ